MMSTRQIRSFFRVAGFWKSSETLTRTHGCVFHLWPSLNTTPAAFTRSLFICSRSYPSPQGLALSSIIASHSRVSLVASGILIPKFSCVSITRGKFRKAGKKKYNQKQKEDDTEDEDDDDDDYDDDEMALESGADFREVKARVSSLRMDAVLKAGLNMSRNKVETAFYASKIRINGKKLLKKGHQCHQGDEIDVIKTVSRQNPKNLYVSRVVVVALGSMDEDDDKLTVKLRRYPNLLIECYEDFKVPEQEE